MMRHLLKLLALILVTGLPVACSGGGGTAPLPPQLTITPAGVAGNVGDTVTFQVEGVKDIVSYAWNFGGGALPHATAEPSPTVELRNAGNYTVSLSVVFLSGTEQHHTQMFQIISRETNWEITDAPELGNPGTSSNIYATETQLAVTFEQSLPPRADQLHVSTNLIPASASNWEHLHPDRTIAAQSSASQDGRTYIIGRVGSQTPPKEFIYRILLSESVGDWEILTPEWSLDELPDARIREIVLRIIDGRPAVMYTIGVAEPVTWFTIATKPIPTEPTDWTEPVRVRPLGAYHADFGEYDGRIALTYGGALFGIPTVFYQETTVLVPIDDSFEQWGYAQGYDIAGNLLGDSDIGPRPRLFISHGVPTIDAAAGGRGRWFRATQPHPTHPSQWVNLGLEGGQMVFDGERLAVLRVVPKGLYIQRALTDNPLAADDFTPLIWIDLFKPPVPDHFVPGPLGPSVATANGRIYVLYPADFELGSGSPQFNEFATLRLAYSDGTWTD